MKNSSTNNITSMPVSPDDDRKSRMLTYSIAMSMRLVCIAACFLTPGWWLLVPAIGAIVLPLFAVLIANAASPALGVVVERPGQVSLYTP